jgi:endonuclease/exonuclease/phosphatase family metal-dependent hydrolase
MASLRVATFNLLHGMAPGSGSTDPELLAAAVRELDADLIGLQEVDRGAERTGGIDQTALVARSLGAAWHRFVPSVHGTPSPLRTWSPATAVDGEDTVGPTYGIGLVSRLPVRSWWVKRFGPAPARLPLLVPGDGRPRLLLIPDEPRLALAAVVDGPAGPFTVVTAHLSFVPGWNVRQLRAIARWVARMPQPVLLIGDLNLPGVLPSRLIGWAPLVTAPTYPAPSPKVQLDHILGLGIGPDRVSARQVWLLGVSDHRAVSVDLDVEGFSPVR